MNGVVLMLVRSSTRTFTLMILCCASTFISCLFQVNFDSRAMSSESDAWMTRQFSGDNKTFGSILTRVSGEVEKSSNPEVIVGRYKLLAKANSNSDAAAFAWAAAVNASDAKLDIPVKTRDSLKIGVSEYLSNFGTRSYEFVRMRFLFGWNDNQLNPKMRALADRLLSVNAKDADVLRDSAYIWGSDPKKAIRLAQEAITAAPDDPRGYRSLGFVYVGVYVGSEKPNDGRLAIEALQKFVDLAPRASDSRAEAEGWIVATEKILSRQAASSKK